MIQQPATPTGPGDELNGVSCVSSVSCVAVGTTPATPGGHAETVLGERWSGTSWSIEPVATPPAGSGVLNAVSCPSVTFCAAVGTSAGGALAESS
jgi:hypothetical protein